MTERAPRLACLPMYDWPEERARTVAFWDGLRARALALDPDLDLPATLTTPSPGALMALWRDPALVFGQTCWGPLSLGLIDDLLPLAQPDYSDVPGGRGPYYRSSIVARGGVALAPPRDPAAALPANLLNGQRLALNGRESLSGYLGLCRDLGADPCDLAVDCLETGSHRASVRAVAAGAADVAAIDCRSWALACRHEPCAAGLVVIGWTSERWGLPYVTHRATDAATAQALRTTLKTLGCHDAPDQATD